MQVSSFFRLLGTYITTVIIKQTTGGGGGGGDAVGFADKIVHCLYPQVGNVYILSNSPPPAKIRIHRLKFFETIMCNAEFQILENSKYQHYSRFPLNKSLFCIHIRIIFADIMRIVNILLQFALMIVIF